MSCEQKQDATTTQIQPANKYTDSWQTARVSKKHRQIQIVF
jgi:hypothetical protein